MRTGRSLTELAQEIDRQRATRKDFTVPSTEKIPLVLTPEVVTVGSVTKPEILMDLGSFGRQPIRELAHEQIAEHTGIPLKYYRRMKTEQPQLLVNNVNTWFQKEPSKRLVRSLDSHVRAFLSERYHPLDNYDLLEAILPTLHDQGVNVVSCEVTEKRLYIQAVNERVSGEVKVGETVQAGISISNSEVGYSSLSIQPLVYTLRCTNGMIVADMRMRKYHVSRSSMSGMDENIEQFFKDDTKKANDVALFKKVRDLTEASLQEALFTQVLNRLKEAAGQKLETNDPVKVIERLGDKEVLSQDERGSVLKFLIEGGDLSKWGLISAVTSTANISENYDRSAELMKLGGDILDYNKTAWDSLVEVK